MTGARRRGNQGDTLDFLFQFSSLRYLSPLIEGAWAGRLVHLSGLDVTGSTAGSLSRLFQDREIELWESKRVVREASPEEVRKVLPLILLPSCMPQDHVRRTLYCSSDVSCYHYGLEISPV